ncbi:MAG: threonine ammonia-lyase [Epsilonproteobacteria bacterium]|nr:MAG: threonine ammonia-lyase [Campylobacterota bacterium]
MIDIIDIKKAQENLDGIVYKTPLAYAPVLSDMVSNNIYLKKENLQQTGSFKLRGAFNKISKLSKQERDKGIVASSAGNHAQGVAYSAKYFNCDATIVMPEATPQLKINGVKSYGVDVVLHGDNYDEAYKKAVQICQKEQKNFIHPYEDDDVICGQATIGLEILQQLNDIDIVLVPIGGGGLIAGVAKAIKYHKPDIKIVGVVASGAMSMKESFEAKKPINSKTVKTIADGIAVRDTSEKMLKLLLESIDDIVKVEDKEIANAVLFLLEKQKIVVEGAGATTVAALLHNRLKIKNKNIVALLSGGNIDVTMLSVIIEKGLIKSSRKMNMVVTLIDKPGALKELTNIFEACQANIVQIDYDRASLSLDFGDANVTISLETKGEQHQTDIRKALRDSAYNFKELR